jgi:hypothetical protein
MTDEEEPKEARHELGHPFETVHDIVEEAEQGRSPWTPFIALESVSVVIVIVVVVVMGLAFLAYYLAT